MVEGVVQTINEQAFQLAIKEWHGKDGHVPNENVIYNPTTKKESSYETVGFTVNPGGYEIRIQWKSHKCKGRCEMHWVTIGPLSTQRPNTYCLCKDPRRISRCHNAVGDCGLWQNRWEIVLVPLPG